MSLPRNSRIGCSGDGFGVKICDRRAKILDGIKPRCTRCKRSRERILAQIQRGEEQLEDEMLAKAKQS